MNLQQFVENINSQLLTAGQYTLKKGGKCVVFLAVLQLFAALYVFFWVRR
jgi:hypothetical protein